MRDPGPAENLLTAPGDKTSHVVWATPEDAGRCGNSWPPPIQAVDGQHTQLQHIKRKEDNERALAAGRGGHDDEDSRNFP